MVTSTISEINNIWNKTLKIVEQRLNDRHIYDSFFSLSRIHKIDGNKMIIVLNSKLAIQIIETKYKVMLDEIIQEVTSSNYELQFITEADIENEIAKVKSSSEKKKFFQNSSESYAPLQELLLLQSEHQPLQARLTEKKASQFL